VKKALCAILLPLFLASAATAQSLAEAAQKEKERREILKGKPGVVVTNADLSKNKKKPMVAIPPAEAAAEGPAGTQVAGDAAGAAQAKLLETARQAEIQKRFDEKKTDLESKAALSKERTELLNLKLKSLQQQFYTFANMQTKDQIQKQITETYQTLQAAAVEEARAKDELDRFLELGAKDKAAAAGIK
jgi:hypothetical protein